MLGSNFALLVKSPGDDGQQLLTTGSRLVCISLNRGHSAIVVLRFERSGSEESFF